MRRELIEVVGEVHVQCRSASGKMACWPRNGLTEPVDLALIPDMQNRRRRESILSSDLDLRFSSAVAFDIITWSLSG